MAEQLSVETMVCNEYQTLFEESQSALEIWHEHRAEICHSRLFGEGSKRRTPSIASQVRASLHNIAEPRAPLPPMSVGVKN